MTNYPEGDPAFRGSSAITHEPVVEEERASPVPDSRSLRRPLPLALTATLLAIAGLAVVAGVAVGWQYVIPFAVLAGLVLFFFGFHRAQEAAGATESIPHLGFDEQSEPAEGGAHEDTESSSGRR